MQTNKVIAVVLFVCITVFCVFGVLAVTANTRSFMATAEKAEGAITGISSNHSFDGKYVYEYPEISFKDAKGEQITFTTQRSVKGYSVGDQVSVLYDPVMPQHAIIDTFMQIWQSVIIFGIVWVFLLFILYDIFYFREIREGKMKAPSV